MPEIRVDRLQAILQYIKDHPQRWDQTWWAQRTECGTAYCFAGHAAQQAGWAFEWVAGDKSAIVRKRGASHRKEMASAVARRYLGLTVHQAAELFRPDNSLATIERLINEWSEEAKRA